MIYKIEIWQYCHLEEVYIEEDIQEILTWFKYYWCDTCNNGNAAFYVYKNGIELSFDELYELGFY